MSWLASIFSFVSEPIKGWQDRKTLKVKHAQEIAVLEQKVKLTAVNARIKAIETGQAQDFDLDRLAMQNMNKSFKDELVLLVFIAPMIMAFIPGISGYALEGFNVIESMPAWYTAIIIGMVVVIYGMRGLLKSYLEKGAKWKR